MNFDLLYPKKMRVCKKFISLKCHYGLDPQSPDNKTYFFRRSCVKHGMTGFLHNPMYVSENTDRIYARSSPFATSSLFALPSSISNNCNAKSNVSPGPLPVTILP